MKKLINEPFKIPKTKNICSAAAVLNKQLMLIIQAVRVPLKTISWNSENRPQNALQLHIECDFRESELPPHFYHLLTSKSSRHRQLLPLLAFAMRARCAPPSVNARSRCAPFLFRSEPLRVRARDQCR